MDHVLDNPAWNALISGNKYLSNGDDDVKFFSRDVSPFVGFNENTGENFEKLYHLIPYDGPVGFITAKETPIPKPWKLLQKVSTFQMVHNEVSTPFVAFHDLVLLTEKHVPEMLDLVKLTRPGPFAARTIEFGHYKGIFEDGKLVAMNGQRLQIFDYAEISAVCTHPDYLGKGYARQLLLSQINRIKAESKIPILHVRTDNHRAITVYQSTGFTIRKEIYFHFLKKEN